MPGGPRVLFLNGPHPGDSQDSPVDGWSVDSKERGEAEVSSSLCHPWLRNSGVLRENRNSTFPFVLSLRGLL